MKYTKTITQQRKRNHEIEAYNGKYKEKFTSIIVRENRYLTRWRNDSHNQTILMEELMEEGLYNTGLFEKVYTPYEILLMSSENSKYGQNILNKINEFGIQEFINDLVFRQYKILPTKRLATKYGCDMQREGDGKTNFNIFVEAMFVYSGGYADFLTEKINKKGACQIRSIKKYDAAIQQYLLRKKLPLKVRTPFRPSSWVMLIINDILALKSKYAYETAPNEYDVDLKLIREHIKELKNYSKYKHKPDVLKKLDEIIVYFKIDKR